MLSFILALSIALHTFFDPTAWGQRKKLLQDLNHLQAQNTELTAHISDLRAQMEALKKRPDVQEHVIRDELGYVHPDDLIIDLGVKRPR
jgi:cell division protein FtsB